ncbi:MAG: type II toxin-antitoxin system VapB family antitoxin [Kiritimatiellia bacterium]
MKTTIDIPDQALRDVLRNSGAKTKREAVLMAIDEFNRNRRLAGFLRRAGRSKTFMALDELKTLRERGG